MNSGIKKAIRSGGSAALKKLPPEQRRRVREVKRAALGQPSLAEVEQRATAKKDAKKKARAAARTTEPTGNRADAQARTDGPVRSVPGVTRLELRRQNIFATAPSDGTFLEIGPAHNAILPKREGFRTKTVDYLDREGLVDKYKGFPQYSMDDIEDVDFVLAPGATMAESINETFDMVLASHVIEHTTSLIDFVNESARLLKPGGVLALVVPDHRYCFDRFRQRSGLGQIIDASVDQKPVHTVGTLTEFGMFAVRHRGGTSWAPQHAGDYSFSLTPDRVRAVADSATSGRYVDVHHWVFSPHYLRLLLNDLADLGYITLREAHFHNTVGHEFFLNLTAEASGPGLSRPELIDLADQETRSLDAPTWEPT